MNGLRKIPLWVRWTAGSLLLLLMIVAGLFLYSYLQLHRTSLEDIEQRVQERRIESHFYETLDSAGIQATPPPSSEAKEGPTVPKGMEEALSIAAGNTDQSIDKQDAMDVASILVKAGLSMREMYDLMGKSENKLNHDEQRRIRRQLLAKLSPREVDLLRQLVAPYGKKLRILDPAFPIGGTVELDLIEKYYGADSEQAKAAIEGTLPGQEVKANSSSVPGHSDRQSSQAGKSAQAGQSSQAGQSGQVGIADQAGQSDASGQSSETVGSEQTMRETQAIQDAEVKFISLQSACSIEVNEISSEIVAEIESEKAEGKEIDIQKVASRFLPRISAAEKACDRQFSSILADAMNVITEANPIIATWRQNYDTHKHNAEQTAMQHIVTALK